MNMKKNSLLMVAVAMAVAGGVRAGEPAQGTRPPALTVVAPYYDGANFASRIRNPVRVAVGLADTTCAPCAVWAMFNEIPSADKRIREEPGMGHGVRGSVWQEFTPWRKEPWQK